VCQGNKYFKFKGTFSRKKLLRLFTTVKEFADFSYPYRSTTPQTLSVSLFGGSKKSGQLLQLAGRCEQGAVR
jgi:hypothetical protein